MIEMLTQEEKQALLELMACLVRADGRVRDVERELLAGYAELFHIQWIDGSCNCDIDLLDSLAAQFQRPESRVIVLQELLQLAHLDGFFNKDEKSLIIRVATLMGVPENFLKKIDEWVLQGIEWTLRGEELLESASSILVIPPE
ncbi:MAG: TerB family tellurite resistance protein [Candidatus Hydrogenedentes bacterium]|nr:TerB family tellurite resistance protein [Candidatus Hydrogenedentota bacterium]